GSEVSELTVGVGAEAARLSFVFNKGGCTSKFCRVLIALNAMIPDTATMWRSRTISNARDNFMFGCAISPYSISVGTPLVRRAVAARNFLPLTSFRIFTFIWGELARARETDRHDPHSS